MLQVLKYVFNCPLHYEFLLVHSMNCYWTVRSNQPLSSYLKLGNRFNLPKVYLRLCLQFIRTNELFVVYKWFSRLVNNSGWSSEAAISRLGHPKMTDEFPGEQLRGRISSSVGNKHSKYLDHISCMSVGVDSDSRIWVKRRVFCKREGDKLWRDAGFSCAWCR